MKQKETMLLGEADAWFERNKDQLGLYDPVTLVIRDLNIRPQTVLEVGCANGWRLAKLRDLFGSRVFGVDPSMKAGLAAAELRIPVHQMTASVLPVHEDGYDLIIYGFCLYLVDPYEWLTIAAEGDRALKTGGHIIIHDFNDWVGGKPFAKRYEHMPRISAHHYDFAKLWLGHPRYQIIKHTDGAHNDGVTVLRKNDLTDSIRMIP